MAAARGAVWMQHWLMRLLCVGLVLFALPVFLNVLPSASLGFDIDRQADGYRVRALPEVPLPPGLEAGDRLELAAMSTAARAALVVSNLPDGFGVDVVVRRGEATLTVPVTAQQDRTRRAQIGDATNIPIAIVFALLLLVTLFRGRDWSAWGLSLFALGVFLQNTLQNLPLDPLLSLPLTLVGIAVVNGLTLPGLYLAADALAGAGLPPGWRRRLRRLVIALAVFNTVFTSLRLGWVVYEGSLALGATRQLSWLPQMLLAGLPMLLLAIGYRRSDRERRLRIRWVLWSTGLLFALIVFQSRGVALGITALLACAAVLTLSVSGLLYAVLRHRLVDVSFVVDRTLVYGLTTGFVVGVFALLEQLIEKLAVGNDASLVLQAGTTLVVALVLNRVHRRVEATVDRLLFQRQHRSVEQLRAFARECLHVEQAERLLPLAADRVASALGSPAVRLYARQAGGYVLRAGASQGSATAVDLDDPLFLSLRSQRQPLQLASVDGSALGGEGWAFPMRLRDELAGALLVIPAPGLQFAPDEREALATLAQELALAQAMLRAREQERFIAAIAAGAVDTPRLQTQARQLLQDQASRA